MSQSKRELADNVLIYLKKIGISLNDDDKKRLVEQNMVNILGSECKIANTMTATRFNVTVNKNWFSKTENKEKPYFRVNNRGPQIEFENVLFLAKNSLFMIDYLRLRECCLKLEIDQDKWFNKATWGVELDEATATFQLAGGNRKKFERLLLLTH